MKPVLILAIIAIIFCGACSPTAKRTPLLSPTPNPPPVVHADPVKNDLSEGKGVVRAVRGTALYLKPSGEWVPLKVGEILRNGSIVQSETAAQVDIFMGQNGPVIRILENSVLMFEQLAYWEEDVEIKVITRLALIKGKLHGNVKKLSPKSTYEVSTAKGVMKVQGTEYSVCFCGELLVKSGRATMSMGGQTYTVEPGQYFNPVTRSVSAF